MTKDTTNTEPINTPDKTDTHQSAGAGVVRDETGKFAEGSTPPAGFNANPQNRSAGGWDKNTSISYWYNHFIRLPRDEFDDWDMETPPCDRTMAQEIAFQRVKAAKELDRLGLDNAREITDRTEGKAPQVVTNNIRRSALDGMGFTKEELMATLFGNSTADVDQLKKELENTPDDIPEPAPEL